MATNLRKPRALSPHFVAGCIAFAVLGTFIFMAIAESISDSRPVHYRGAEWAIALHVGTVVPAFFLGAPVLLMRKGTTLHKLLGRIWAALMITTAVSSFWLTGLTGGLSPIHIFSVVTLISIPWGIYNARMGNIRVHQRAMTGPYIGLVIAGLLSFLPGRMLGDLVFG